MSDYIPLSDALSQLALLLELSPSELIAYADEDSEGGADTGYAGMSIDRDEGRLLYALVRALQPQHAIEIGTCEGVSTLHLLAALSANGAGTLDSYDIDADAGKLVTPSQDANWTFHSEDALEAAFKPAEFVFEDAAHTMGFSVAMYERLKVFAPHVLVVHDYFTDEVYGNFFVRQAFEQVFGDAAHGFKLEGCFRGLGVWVNPDYRLSPEMPLLKEEVDALTSGETLEVKRDGSAKLTSRRNLASDKVTRTPAANKPTTAKRAAKKS